MPRADKATGVRLNRSERGSLQEPLSLNLMKEIAAELRKYPSNAMVFEHQQSMLTAAWIEPKLVISIWRGSTVTALMTKIFTGDRRTRLHE